MLCHDTNRGEQFTETRTGMNNAGRRSHHRDEGTPAMLDFTTKDTNPVRAQNVSGARQIERSAKVPVGKFTGSTSSSSQNREVHGAPQPRTFSFNGNIVLNDAPQSWIDRLTVPGQTLYSVRARQTFYRAGEPLDGIPVVCEGWAARVSRLSDGRRQILSFIFPGDLVSTDAVFASSLSVFVEAITAVRYCLCDRAEVHQRLTSEPELFNALLSRCLAEKEEADQLATNLGRRRAEARIAHLFLTLKARLKARGLVQNRTFELPLRQQQIADATGLTTVHVNRVFGSLRDEGLIQLSAGTVRIPDLAALRRLADSN